MHPLAQRVLTHIRQHELLHAGDRVGVAVSGGIDSVALLRLLLDLRNELGIVLSVVHFNHKLRGDESDADEQFVAALARKHDLEFHHDGDDVAQVAAQEHISVETAARDLRYGFFRHLIGEDTAQGLKPPSNAPLDGSAGSRAPSKQNKIVTGHTLDDQAETVLMRLIRGAGLRGLGGIHPRIPVDDDAGELLGEIVRPLLATRRSELERYLNQIGQPWREDSSNAEDHFTRNRIRRLVVPLLEKEFNPAVAGTLAELAEIARGEEDYWENEVAGWMGTGIQWSEPEWAKALHEKAGLVQIAGNGPASPSEPDSQLQEKIDDAPWLVANASVDRIWFLGEPAAVERRIIKAVGERARIPLEFRHVEEILRFAADESGPGKELSLPLGWKLRREADELVFITPGLQQEPEARDYGYEVTLPGKVMIEETGTEIELLLVPAGVVPAGAEAAYNPDQLLDADSLPRSFLVRNWRAGDRFWPNHTKSPKKIKELLQERHLEQPQRKLWPVMASGDEIVWVRGFPPPSKWRARPGRNAIAIIEKPRIIPAFR